MKLTREEIKEVLLDKDSLFLIGLYFAKKESRKIKTYECKISNRTIFKYERTNDTIVWHIDGQTDEKEKLRIKCQVVIDTMLSPSY